MTRARRFLVLGAGLSGLSAAFRLTELRPDAHVEVWEASARTGGWIATEQLDARTLGCESEQPLVVDLGPESILRDKPAGTRLVARLGLEDRVIRTRTDRHGAYVVTRGALARIPEGFSLIGPGDLVGFARSDVVSFEGKARAALELAMPARPRGETEDESLASFVRRRFGWEVLERLAQPLASGIYGADAEILGLLGTMPRFLEMEAQHGSVTRALVAAARKAREQEGSGARYGLFFSFDGGMQVLTDALLHPEGHGGAEDRAVVRAAQAAVGGDDQGERPGDDVAALGGAGEEGVRGAGDAGDLADELEDALGVGLGGGGAQLGAGELAGGDHLHRFGDATDVADGLDALLDLASLAHGSGW